jgi:tetratricopeptide (TPR) repeat protein
LAERSAELDDRDPHAHLALAVAHMWIRDLDRAVTEAKRTLVLDPNSAMAYAILGNTLGYAGRPAEAIESLERAMRLDPQYPDLYLHFLGHAHVVAGDYEKAVEILRRRVRRNPGTDVSRVLLASCYGHLGRPEDARAEWQAALEANPAFSLEQKGSVLPYSNPADWQRILDGLAKAGLAE